MKCESWIDQHGTSVEQGKSLIPWQKSNPWLPKHMGAKVIDWVHVTGALHTARISTVKVIVSSDKQIKMVNFKLSNEIWKVNWSTWDERGTKKYYSWKFDLIDLSNSRDLLYHYLNSTCISVHNGTFQKFLVHTWCRKLCNIRNNNQRSSKVTLISSLSLFNCFSS